MEKQNKGNLKVFVDNKWKRIYFNIIEKAKQRGLDKDDLAFYVERHHILPRSIGGGDNVDNLVLLTAKEHFVCHHLLTKITKGKQRRQLEHAFSQMVFCTKYTPTSRNYSMARELYAQRGRNKEWRRRISESHKGKKPSKESVEKMRKSLTGRKLSDSHRENIRKASKQRGISKQCREANLRAKVKTFRVVFPTGEEAIVKNLKQYCLDNDINYPSASTNSKTDNPIRWGPLKGYNFVKC